MMVFHTVKNVKTVFYTVFHHVKSAASSAGKSTGFKKYAWTLFLQDPNKTCSEFACGKSMSLVREIFVRSFKNCSRLPGDTALVNLVHSASWSEFRCLEWSR